MEIDLILGVRQALLNSEALSQWAQDHNLPVPAVRIGYRQPKSAHEWPFVSLVAGSSQVELMNRNTGRAAVHLICGVRFDEIGDGGYEAVSRLDAAVLGDLRQRGGLGGDGWNAVPAEARLLDIDLSHPLFQIERALVFLISIR